MIELVTFEKNGKENFNSAPNYIQMDMSAKIMKKPAMH